MTKQRWIIGAALLLVGLGVGCWVLDRVAYQRFSQRTTFAEFVPSTPLMYLQVSRLQERVAHLRDSPDFQTFLHSEAARQLQEAAWWPVFRENFNILWRSLIIDPMRIIGSEAAIAVYETPAGEFLPALILIGRVDRVARIAERGLYGYDRVAHQVGITFAQTYQRTAIYKIEQPYMICPLYYALTGDIGMIATSLPLLHSTLDGLLKRIQQPVTANIASSSLCSLLGAIPTERFITGHIELARLSNEFRQNPLLSLFGWFQEAAWLRSETFPQIVWRVDTWQDHIVVQTDWFTEATLPVANETVTFRSVPKTDAPLVMARYQQAFTNFVASWQSWFPAWQWDVGSLFPEQISNIYGEILECQVADQLVGAGLPYPLPDVSCIVDTQDSAASAQFFDSLVQQVTELLPALLRRSIKIVNTPYQDTTLTSVRFLIQELFSYAAIKKNLSLYERDGYTLLSTNVKNVRLTLDRLHDQPEIPPYTLHTPSTPTAFLAVIQPDRLSALLRAAIQTNTMKLVVPPQASSEFYRVVPGVIQALEPLPRMTLWGESRDHGVSVELRIYPRQPATTNN